MPKTLRPELLLALIALLLIVAGYYWNIGLELFNDTRPGQDNTIDYYAENAQPPVPGGRQPRLRDDRGEAGHQKATDITFVTTPTCCSSVATCNPGTSRAPAPKSDRKARRRTHRRRARRTYH